MIIDTLNVLTHKELREKYGNKLFIKASNYSRSSLKAKATLQTIQEWCDNGNLVGFEIGNEKLVDLSYPFELGRRRLVFDTVPIDIHCLFRSQKGAKEKQWELMAWYKRPPTIYDLNKTFRPDKKLKQYLEFIHHELMLYKYVEIRNAWYRVERVQERNPTHW